MKLSILFLATAAMAASIPRQAPAPPVPQDNKGLLRELLELLAPVINIVGLDDGNVPSVGPTNP